MSYAFAPARCVASKNGDFRYHGPKNKVLWPSLCGMSSPPENWAGNAHRLFEEFLTQRAQLAAEWIPSNRISCFKVSRRPSSRGLGSNPSFRRAFWLFPRYVTPARSRSRSDRDRAAMARRKPGEAWNRGAGIPVIRSATSNASISVWGGPAMMYASPALARSIARMCARRILDVGPAIRGPFRDGSKIALEVPHARGPDFARVAGTVVDAGLDDDEREPGTDHRFRDLVIGNPFRPVILRQPPAVVSIGLVDESTVGVREHRQRARVDSFRNPEFFHRGQHVASAGEVEPLSLRGVPRPNLVPARDVEQPVDAGH